MIQLDHLIFDRELEQEELDFFLSLLPVEMEQKFHRYRRWEDRYANLFGKLLILKGLTERGFGRNALEFIQYTDFGKPFIDSKTQFNVSHSGNSILCGFSEHIPIGVDIEEKKIIDIREFDGIFSDLEWNTLLGDPDPTENFYRFWTTKESVIKNVGKGLSLVLKEVMVTDPQTCHYKGVDYHIRLLGLRDGYAAAFATDCRQNHRINHLKVSDLKNLFRAWAS